MAGGVMSEHTAENDAPDDGVTSVEEGCTCGGLAACQQCQERDAASVIPPEEGREEES
jgi:hypothetical protein